MSRSDSSIRPQADIRLAGYELVADMMRRQDDVIEQIDDLNAQIEKAIEALSAARKAEQASIELESVITKQSPSGTEAIETFTRAA